jgi:hypothetical protein
LTVTSAARFLKKEELETAIANANTIKVLIILF